MKKYLFLLLCLLTITMAVQAQDVLYLKSGGTLEVYVKKVTGSLIYYSATPGSPQRFISKSKVERIVNQRGREQVFKEKRKSRETLADAHNVLTLSPLNLLIFGRHSGLGIGLDYERFIGARHLISVRVPVYAGITSTEDVTYDYMPYEEGVFAWTAPGIRLHWLKPTSKADLATGISVTVGNVNHTYYPNDGNLTSNTDEQFLFTAVTLDNDFTVYSKRKVAFGVHTALGPMFGDFGGGKWMVQIGLKLGRKF